ncbi:hypothetical protein BDW66DRAFT_132510 [Aspergillus desertorum]
MPMTAGRGQGKTRIQLLAHLRIAAQLPRARRTATARIRIQLSNFTFFFTLPNTNSITAGILFVFQGPIPHPHLQPASSSIDRPHDTHPVWVDKDCLLTLETDLEVLISLLRRPVQAVFQWRFSPWYSLTNHSIGCHLQFPLLLGLVSQGRTIPYNMLCWGRLSSHPGSAGAASPYPGPVLEALSLEPPPYVLD